MNASFSRIRCPGFDHSNALMNCVGFRLAFNFNIWISAIKKANEWFNSNEEKEWQNRHAIPSPIQLHIVEHISCDFSFGSQPMDVYARACIIFSLHNRFFCSQCNKIYCCRLRIKLMAHKIDRVANKHQHCRHWSNWIQFYRSVSV